MTLQADLFIAGSFVPAKSGERYASLDPSTGHVVVDAASAGREDADAAVAAARRAFDEGAWSRQTAAQRSETLNAVAAGIKARAAEIADIESRDGGATISRTRGADVGSGAFWFRQMAEMAIDLEAPIDITRNPALSQNYLYRDPVGVGAAIIPWNFPFQMACWKISAALAAGNSIVLKTAPDTPGSAALLAQIVADAGVPDGVVNILSGQGSSAAEALVEHPDVDLISFTGSVGVGSQVMRSAAPTLKNVVLELGGKSAQIVLEDADLELAVDGALYAIFFHAGEVCTAGSRLLVPESMHDRFVSMLVDRARDIVVGPALDPTSTMGPLINEGHARRVLSYIEGAVESGAELAFGGSRLTRGELSDGWFVEPTILTNVRPMMPISREEVFGPVLAVATYSTIDEAIALANGSEFGLAGGVWGPGAAAEDVARRMRAGTVWVNDYHLLNPRFPFGGYRRSGVGREHGDLGLLAWTEAKHVHVAADASRASKRWFDAVIPPRDAS